MTNPSPLVFSSSSPLLSSPLLLSPPLSQQPQCYGSDAGLGGQTGSAPLPPLCAYVNGEAEKERGESYFYPRQAAEGERMSECVRRETISALLMKVVSIK